MGNKTLNPKTKKQLDLMTKEQIEKHRVNYLSQSIVKESIARRYFNELDLYVKIRFKDDVFKMYERWSIDKKDEATVFLTGIIDKMGREQFYQMVIEQSRSELGEMQYII